MSALTWQYDTAENLWKSYWKCSQNKYSARKQHKQPFGLKATDVMFGWKKIVRYRCTWLKSIAELPIER